MTKTQKHIRKTKSNVNKARKHLHKGELSESLDVLEQVLKGGIPVRIKNQIRDAKREIEDGHVDKGDAVLFFAVYAPRRKRREWAVTIPEPEPHEPAYPGDIQPGGYEHHQLVEMLRRHKANPEAVQFIADMME